MRAVCTLVLLLVSLQCMAKDVMDMQARSELVDEILAQRFEQVLPSLMQRTNIDMWVIMSREYNEDPVIKTMLPSTWLSARRHTMLVIFNPGEGKPLERLAVARYAVADLFEKAWDKEAQPNQWEALADVIEARDPKRIAVNVSDAFALADGMSSTENSKFIAALSPKFKDRVVSGEKLAIAWLETRSKLEMQHYPSLTQIGHQLIATAFSNEVVTPL